jgi:hypothetical protein
MSENLTLHPEIIRGSALPSTALAFTNAAAGRLATNGTQITRPDEIKWSRQDGFPDNSLDNAVLAGSLAEPPLYLALVRWHPGYMSAPPTYITDRLCVVVSGTWWGNSGPEFDPGNCVPMPNGSFVRRRAHTPHYDGVVSAGKEPAVVAICGFSPVGARLVDPASPGWKSVYERRGQRLLSREWRRNGSVGRNWCCASGRDRTTFTGP